MHTDILLGLLKKAPVRVRVRVSVRVRVGVRIIVRVRVCLGGGGALQMPHPSGVLQMPHPSIWCPADDTSYHLTLLHRYVPGRAVEHAGQGKQELGSKLAIRNASHPRLV